jgi:hypothetical protein
VQEGFCHVSNRRDRSLSRNPSVLNFSYRVSISIAFFWWLVVVGGLVVNCTRRSRKTGNLRFVCCEFIVRTQKLTQSDKATRALDASRIRTFAWCKQSRIAPVVVCTVCCAGAHVVRTVASSSVRHRPCGCAHAAHHVHTITPNPTTNHPATQRRWSIASIAPTTHSWSKRVQLY